MKQFDKETPIPILNSTHIELRRLVKYKGETAEAKWLGYVADIVTLEASRTSKDDKPCTRVYTRDDVFRVRESYNRLKETWLTWLEWAKSFENENDKD